MSEALLTLVNSLTETIKAKSIAHAKAYWNLAATGRDEDAKRATELETELRLFLSNREHFAKLKAAVEQPTGDPVLDRQATRLYASFLENQMEKAEIEDLVRRANELEQIFSNFRGQVEGRSLTDNEIRELLSKSNDSEERHKAWQASKQVGTPVAAKLRDLVRARNKVARRLGFPNFYAMQLELSEIKQDELFALLDQLRRLTDAPFAAMKQELDASLAQRFGVAPSSLRPWHYADPFFQEVPTTGGVDLDPYFAGKSIEELATRFYDGIGVDVRDIIAHSDLYEREGKNQHAFCMNVDREGDVRVLCNLKPTEWWVATMLHELGHAIYDKHVDPALPWLLRENAHINSTEAVAMYFGRLTSDADWLHRIAGVPEAEAQAAADSLHKQQSRAMLILTRWVLVMVGFESRLYEDPEQDLNALWWHLVNELQLLTPPEELTGDEWACKIHLTIAPVYYHNYLMGEVTASHLLEHIARATGTRRIAENPGVGEWHRERFFKPGALYPWDELLVKATGEPLNPEYFVKQFVTR